MSGGRGCSSARGSSEVGAEPAWKEGENQREGLTAPLHECPSSTSATPTFRRGSRGPASSGGTRCRTAARALLSHTPSGSRCVVWTLSTGASGRRRRVRSCPRVARPSTGTTGFIPRCSACARLSSWPDDARHRAARGEAPEDVESPADVAVCGARTGVPHPPLLFAPPLSPRPTAVRPEASSGPTSPLSPPRGTTTSAGLATPRRRDERASKKFREVGLNARVTAVASDRRVRGGRAGVKGR